MDKRWIYENMAYDRALDFRGGDQPVEAPSEPDTNDIGVNVSHARNHTLDGMKALNEGDKDAAMRSFDLAQHHMAKVEDLLVQLALVAERI